MPSGVARPCDWPRSRSLRATRPVMSRNAIWEYSAVGRVVNLASRLCDEAQGGQILLGPPAYAAVEASVRVQSIGPLTLKGFTGRFPPSISWQSKATR